MGQLFMTSYMYYPHVFFLTICSTSPPPSIQGFLRYKMGGVVLKRCCSIKDRELEIGPAFYDVIYVLSTCLHSNYMQY